MLKSICTLLLVANASFAAVVDSFDRSESGIADTPALKAAIADQDGRKALALEWRAEHKAWAECIYAKPVPLADFKPGQLMALKLMVWVPPSPGVSSIAIRIVDKENEIFQWSSKLAAVQTGGWQQVTVPIDPAQSNSHWGGKPNGQLDYPLRLLGYAFVYANGKVPAGRLLISDVQSAPLPKITLETNAFPGIVYPGAAAQCAMAISNPDTAPVRATFTGKVTDYSGTSTEISANAMIPASGSASIPLPIKDTAPGIRWIEGSIRLGETDIAFKDSFVIAEPLQRISRADDFLFGICSHTERHSTQQQEQEMQAAAAAGATIMRVGPAWASIEPKPDQWKWETQDRIVEIAAKYGIETQPILGFSPSHAISDELRAQQQEAYRKGDANAWKISLFGAPREDAWRKFVYAMATRYRGKIRFYEIWNEPDLSFWRGTTEEYINILRAAHEEIRRADPQAKVMSGGFATVLPHASRAKNPDLQQRVLTEAIDAFDIHAIHQHGPFQEFRQAVEGEFAHLRSLMRTPKPVYFNETAFSSSFGGEKLQAQTLVKKMSYVMASGAMGYTWYDLRDDGINPADPEHHYGLVKPDFSPKASFAAYLELVRQLQGMRPLGRYDLGQGQYAYAFGSARGRVVVLWNDGEQATALPLLIPPTGQPHQAQDIMGRVRPLAEVENVAMVQSAGEPVYLNFPPGEGMPDIAGPFIQIDAPTEAFVGNPLKLAAVVKNPLSRELKVNLTWVQTGGQNGTKILTIPAHGDERIAIDAGSPAPKWPQHVINVRYAADGTPWSGTMRRAISITRLIDSEPADHRQPDWTLDQLQDVVNFTGADPALAAMHWRGSQDLSARVWVWKKEGQLCVRADVQDDTHIQKETAADMWKADCVQLAFALPDQKEYWELGVAQNQDGQTLTAAWKMPAGTLATESLFTATCSPIAGGLRYELQIPLANLQLDEPSLARGLRFNLIVNDNDANLRKQMVRIAPGIGEQKNANLFTRIQFAPVQK